MTKLFFTLSLIFILTKNAQAANETIPSGAFIINMGILPQTIGNGLKPYGLVYDLLRNYNIPIKWVIEPSKIKDGVDFIYNGVSYKSGAFVIPTEYRSATINARIIYWQSLGVVGVTTTTSITIPVFTTLYAPPNWTMDKDNGSIAADFFVDAGIPPTAHGGSSDKLWKLPAELDCCDDLFVMPHADPTWATHSNLYTWNLTCKGGIWLGCHAGSALEDMFNPATPTQQTNFLSEKIVTAFGNDDYFENALLLWGNHDDGTLPYTYDFHSDPIMQFMGTIDAATENGSEQIYIPLASGWRPTTKVAVYDADHPQRSVPYIDPKHRAAVLAYGPGFGNNSRGKVMMEASHDIGGSSAANVAAQRAFFNFSLQTANEKAVIPNISLIPSPMVSGTPTSLTYTIPVGAIGSPFTTLWTSSCGGTFTPNNDQTVTFTPPVVASTTNCLITVQLSDVCNRRTFNVASVVILPDYSPVANFDRKITPEDTPIIGATVVTNDVPSLDGGNVYNNSCPVCTTTSNGTLTFNSNGTYNYTPNLNFNGVDKFVYQICDVDKDCDTAIVFITITPANDVPIANPDRITTNEATPITESVVNNDILSGDGGNTFNKMCTLCRTTSNGTLIFNSNGTFVYTPNLNFSGSDFFIYQICDIDGDCDTAIVNITVPTANRPRIGSFTKSLGTCAGSNTLNDAKIEFTNVLNADKADKMEGNSYVGGAIYGALTNLAISNNKVTFTGLKHGTAYTFRFWNGQNAYYKDTTTTTSGCCPIISANNNNFSLCVGTTTSSISVNTDISKVNSIKFVKFDSDQIVVNNSPTSLELSTIQSATPFTLATPIGSSSPYIATYTFNSSDFPNTGNNSRTYYLYALPSDDGGGSCHSVQEIVIVINPLPNFTLVYTDITCRGGSDGTITITPTSGTAPFTYSKDNGITFPNSSGFFNNLLPGAHKIVIKDANGCTKKCK